MPSSTQDGLTPLQAAIRNHHTEVVRKLLDAGADINIADKVLSNFAHNDFFCKLLTLSQPSFNTSIRLM